MVSLMQNACFWGREKGFAEERVKIVRVPMLENAADFVATTPPESGAQFIGKVDSPGAMIQGDNDNSEVGDSSSVEEKAGFWFRHVLQGDRSESEVTVLK